MCVPKIIYIHDNNHQGTDCALDVMSYREKGRKRPMTARRAQLIYYHGDIVVLHLHTAQQRGQKKKGNVQNCRVRRQTGSSSTNHQPQRQRPPTKAAQPGRTERRNPTIPLTNAYTHHLVDQNDLGRDIRTRIRNMPAKTLLRTPTLQQRNIIWIHSSYLMCTDPPIHPSHGPRLP